MSKKYHPKNVTRKIIGVLKQSDIETPTSIARKTGYNQKTISKYVEQLEDLQIIECDTIKLGKRNIKICSIKDLSKEGNKNEK